ncbi:conserved hypothetical protein [Listeria monocytogenes str. 1/2a F6854]|nr:conserved hypothetical protein [Listeria monocytogenes str. 1/2a F6854] [Listeria monocytogenes serotype 1/2a str. F6854]
MKISVTFVLMPSAVRVWTAFKPSSVIGIFTTTFGAHFARIRASSTILSASRPITSALTGPSTIEQISLITSSNGRPSFAMMVGLVVTPSTKPSSLIRFISDTLAVSKKNFIIYSLHSLS